MYSNCKPNKIWAGKTIEFYNRSMKLFLQNNDIEMHSMYNEGNSVTAEKYIRTLKNKTYEYFNIKKCVY